MPYIYEDRLNAEKVKKALIQMYNMSQEERAKLGSLGAKHVSDNYNFKDYKQKWLDLIENIIDNYGSWDTRQGYKSWELLEVS